MRVAIVFVVVAALYSAHAQARTFRCDEVWKNASVDNKIQDCFSSGSHLSDLLFDGDHLPDAVLTILPIILLVFGLICCPLVTCCRYCCNCCGGYRRRPDGVCCGSKEWDEAPPETKSKAYTRGSVIRTKFCALVFLIMACAAAPVGIAGSAKFQDNYNDIFKEVGNVLTWVNDQSTGIRVLLTINSTGQLIPPLTEGLFNTIDAKIVDFRGNINDMKSSADTYVSSGFIIGALIFGLSMLFVAFTAFAACVSIRTCCLCANSCVYYLLFILFSLIAIAFFAAGLVLTDVCGERELFLSNPKAPGIIALAGVPQCVDNFPFETIPGQVNDVITTQAANACNNMLSICSPGTPYDTTQPEKVFECDNLTNGTQDCPTFEAANTIGSAMVLKPTENKVDCVDGSGTLMPKNTCSLDACGSYCNENSTKTIAAQASTSLHYAANAETAFNVYVAPLLDCDAIYKQALAPLTSCDSFVSSIYMVGGPAFAMQFILLFGLISIWRGQKRFFDSSSAFSEEIDATEGESFDDFLKPPKKEAAGESYEMTDLAKAAPAGEDSQESPKKGVPF